MYLGPITHYTDIPRHLKPLDLSLEICVAEEDVRQSQHVVMTFSVIFTINTFQIFILLTLLYMPIANFCSG